MNMNVSEMNSKNIYFVGSYSAFQFNDDFEKWAKLLQGFIDLEGTDSFVEGKVHLKETDRWKRITRFDGATLSKWMREFEEGKLGDIHLYSISEKPDWKRWLAEGTNILLFTAPAVRTKGNPIIADHFGRGGCITVTYPVSRFRIGEKSGFQERLIDLVKRQFVNLRLSWSFVHLGAQPVMPFSVGSDHVFEQSKDAFPFTSFDYDIKVYIIDFFKEYAKGVFWTNFLNPVHVERLGGVDAIKKAEPCSVIEELEGGGVLLQVDDSPLPRDFKEAAVKYQRLRSFLRPILLETGEEFGDVQRKMLGLSHEEYSQSCEEAAKNKALRKILKSG